LYSIVMEFNIVMRSFILTLLKKLLIAIILSRAINSY
jgi:hypothetical protein